MSRRAILSTSLILGLGSGACSTDGPIPSAPASSSSGTSSGTSGGVTTSDDADATGMSKLDVGTATPSGCIKVDFLFVIDNSGSMADEQQEIVAAFPGFISTIQQTLTAQDYHIMVVDTDEASTLTVWKRCTAQSCECAPSPQCCLGLCTQEVPPEIDPLVECNRLACEEYEPPTGCPVALGAGKSEDRKGNPCGVEGDIRYMTSAQPQLVETFECLAKVGTAGDTDERLLESMTLALTEHTAPGGCHEGFLRDDAILVVTFITDEDENNFEGQPEDWAQAIVDAKDGNEDAIAMLAWSPTFPFQALMRPCSRTSLSRSRMAHGPACGRRATPSSSKPRYWKSTPPANRSSPDLLRTQEHRWPPLDSNRSPEGHPSHSA